MYKLQCMPVIKSLSSGAEFPNSAVHLALFIVLLSEVLVREYERAYRSRHVLLTCISLSFLTLQSFTYEDYTSSCTHASARTAFVSTPAVHIFSGDCGFLLNAEI